MLVLNLHLYKHISFTHVIYPSLNDVLLNVREKMIDILIEEYVARVRDQRYN